MPAGLPQRLIEMRLGSGVHGNIRLPIGHEDGELFHFFYMGNRLLFCQHIIKRPIPRDGEAKAGLHEEMAQEPVAGAIEGNHRFHGVRIGRRDAEHRHAAHGVPGEHRFLVAFFFEEIQKLGVLFDILQNSLPENRVIFGRIVIGKRVPFAMMHSVGHKDREAMERKNGCLRGLEFRPAAPPMIEQERLPLFPRRMDDVDRDISTIYFLSL